jgi:hypothetical protein
MRENWTISSLDPGFATLIIAAICSILVALSIASCLQPSATSSRSATAVRNDVGRVTSNHSFKGDRLIGAGTKADDDVKVSRSSATSGGIKIPVGCERAFSAFAKLNHANVAARCVTAINPPSSVG